MKQLALLTLTLSFFLTSAFTSEVSNRIADSDPWVRIGKRVVNFGLDHDVIKVGYRDGYFEKIRIDMKGGAVNMHKCVVHFENGGQKEITLRHNFGPKAPSRVIDLPGNKRFIDRISFWYDSKRVGKGKAVVAVYGRK